MARTKGSTNKVTRANRKSVHTGTQLSDYKIVEKTKRVPVADSETVINMIADGPTFTIGTNNFKLVAKLNAIKAPDSVMGDGYHSYTFDLAEFNFSFLPKKKRTGRKMSDAHKAKMLAAKTGQ